MSEPERRGRGRGTPNDPRRRARILEAAAEIVVERGADAVTFRSVALAAGVPLGSTTYYFADKDLLLLEVLRHYGVTSGERFRTVLSEAVRAHGISAGVARGLEIWTIDERDTFLFEYSLYLAAFHNSVLRTEAARWQMVQVFEEVIDAPFAAALAYLVDGMLLQAMMRGVRFAAVDVEPIVAGVIRGLSPGTGIAE